MPDSSESPAEPPSDYSLIVPQGWFQLHLEPEERDRSILALAELQFKGIDNRPHLKEQLMRDLQRRAKDAHRVGGLELYLSTLTLGPIPLASSLLVSMPPPGEWPSSGSTLEISDHLQSAGNDVSTVKLPAAGEAVREFRKESASPDSQMGNTLPTTTVTYHVPIPGTTRWLLMTFSTPVDPLADQMVELFDVVAQTLQWA